MKYQSVKLICKNQIPIIIDNNTYKYFANIKKMVSEERKSEIQLDNIEIKVLNHMIEYTKLLNIIETNKSGITEFINNLDEELYYDIIITCDLLGFNELLLDLGNKIRDIINS